MIKLKLFTYFDDKFKNYKAISKMILQTPPSEKLKDIKLENFKAYNQVLEMKDLYKNICIKALKADPPREKAIIVDGNNKMIAEFIGDSTSCRIKIPKKIKNLKILHGHPLLETGLTLPISFQDFITLNSKNNIKEIVAYDIYGNESVLRKTKDFVKLRKKNLVKLEKKYKKYLIEAANEEDIKKINQLYNFCTKNKNHKNIILEIANILNQIQMTPKGINIIDCFWKDNASILGLQYIPFKK